MESGKIIVVANQKGGVAKTSTVRNLSYALAEMGKKVLVVDFDPQYNLTTSFGVLPTQAPYNTGTLSAFSFLVEQKPEYARYFTSWEQITPVSFPNPMQNRIIENYCSGVYLSPDQVIQLLKDMEQDPKVLEDLEGLWSNGQIAVLKKALSAAAKSGVGLLEATEVVEPNPISPNESTSYSNLYHCDRDGVYLYIDAVSGQLADAIGKNEG